MAPQEPFNIIAALTALLATAAVLALIWYAVENSDPRIWLAIGLLMALSPFALVWKLVQKDRENAHKNNCDKR